MGMTVTYAATCSECGERHEEMHTGGGELQLPCLPPGWMVVGNRIICPAHKVLIGPLDAE